MPTFTRSALNPNGAYVSDAMDQVEQWNANRGDQWSQFAIQQGNRRWENDWQREIALKQLEQRNTEYQGDRAQRATEYQDGRTDRAADKSDLALLRAAEFKYRGERDMAGDTFRNRSFDETKSFNDLGRADITRRQSRDAEEDGRRQAKIAGYSALAKMPNAFASPEAYAAAIAGFDPEGGMPILQQEMFRRADRKDAAGQARSDRLAGDASGSDPAKRVDARRIIDADPTLKGTIDVAETATPIPFNASDSRVADLVNAEISQGSVRQALTPMSRSGGVQSGESLQRDAAILQMTIKDAAKRIANETGYDARSIEKELANRIGSLDNTGFWRGIPSAVGLPSQRDAAVQEALKFLGVTNPTE